MLAGVTETDGLPQAVNIRLISITFRWPDALFMYRITLDSLLGIVAKPFCPHVYANPNTIPRIRKARYTLCPEWTMTPIQVLRKRQLGNAYRKAQLMTAPGIP
jgi:hypothetical protein